MFDRVKIGIVKVIKGDGSEGRMWKSWGSEKVWFTEKQTQSKQRNHTRISQENGFSVEAGGAGERRMIPKNLKRKDGQTLGTDWASGRGKGLGDSQFGLVSWVHSYTTHNNNR